MTSAAELAIDLHDVAKTYRGKVRALRGISLQVRRGEIFGLLGPNGAGKSTLVKIMTTVVRPSRASGTILGKNIGHKPTLARIGYLPESLCLPRHLTGRQVIEYYGALSKIPRGIRRRRSWQLLETVGMAEHADRKVGSYSKGMAQRIGLAQALVNEPDLVMLDEPASGLDPLGRKHLRELLAALRNQGKTVFLNSHLLSEIERICDRVAILVEGTVIKQGRLDQMTRDKQFYEIETAGAEPSAIRSALPGEAGRQRPIEIHESRIRVASADPADVQPILDALRQAGIVIAALRPVGQSLEDLFVEAVTKPSDSSAEPSSGGGR